MRGECTLFARGSNVLGQVGLKDEVAYLLEQRATKVRNCDTNTNTNTNTNTKTNTDSNTNSMPHLDPDSTPMTLPSGTSEDDRLGRTKPQEGRGRASEGRASDAKAGTAGGRRHAGRVVRDPKAARVASATLPARPDSPRRRRCRSGYYRGRFGAPAAPAAQQLDSSRRLVCVQPWWHCGGLGARAPLRMGQDRAGTSDVGRRTEIV